MHSIPFSRQVDAFVSAIYPNMIHIHTKLNFEQNIFLNIKTHITYELPLNKSSNDGILVGILIFGDGPLNPMVDCDAKLNDFYL